VLLALLALLAAGLPTVRVVVRPDGDLPPVAAPSPAPNEQIVLPATTAAPETGPEPSPPTGPAGLRTVPERAARVLRSPVRDEPVERNGPAHPGPAGPATATPGRALPAETLTVSYPARPFDPRLSQHLVPAVEPAAGPLRFVLTGGSLPPGLLLDPETGRLATGPIPWDHRTGNYPGHPATLTIAVTDGRVSASTTVHLTVAPPPPTAPAGVTAAHDGRPGLLIVAWNPPTSGPVSHHQVDYRAAGSDDWLPHPSSPVDTATIDGLEHATTYELRVTAHNSSGAASTIVTATTAPAPLIPGPPTAPTGVTVAPGDGSLDVSWSAPASDGGAPITEYLVEYRLSGVSGWTSLSGAASSSTTARITGLVNGTEYEVRVTARNAAGPGAPSSGATGTPRTVPDAPTGVSATPGDTTLTVSWTAPASDGGASVDDYTLEVRTSPSGSWTAFTDGTSTTTNATITGLTNGTAYDVRVAAVNAAGAGSWSSTVTGTPQTVPAAPTAVSVMPGDTTLTVSWTAPASDGGSAITGYEYAVDGGAWTTAGTSPFTLTGLTNGSVHVIAVRAVNAVGPGPSSAPVNGTPGGWSQLGPDIDAEAANDLGGWSVALSADATVLAIGARGNDGTAADAGHTRVYVWDGTTWTRRGTDIDGEAGGDQAGTAVALSADGNVLAVGAPYNDGSGINAGHTRVYVWDGTTWTRRGTDIDGEAGGDQAGTAVDLSADGNVLAAGAQGNDGNGFSAGHVRVRTWDGTAWTRRGADLDGEAADDTFGRAISLSPDGAVLAAGATLNDASGYNAGHTRVFRWATPGAPRDLTAAPGPSRITLTWTAAPIPGGAGPTTDHVIQRSTDGVTWTTVDDGVSAGTTVTVTGLTAGTPYQFRVAAVNDAGAGPWSAIAGGTPDG
jgi:hypothetical protein